MKNDDDDRTLSAQVKRDSLKSFLRLNNEDSNVIDICDYESKYDMICDCQGREDVLRFAEETQKRAKDLAALQRLYSVDYDNGTWL